MKRLVALFVILAASIASAQTVKFFARKVVPGGPDITFAQSAVNASQCTNATLTATIAQAFSGAVTAGCAIVVAYKGSPDICSAASGTTVSDATNGTYTIATSLYNATNNQCGGIAYFVNSAAGTHTPTVNYGGSGSGFRAIFVHEYCNVATSSAVDGTPTSTQTDGITTWVSGATTTTATGLVFGAVTVGGSSASAHTAGSGYVERHDEFAGGVTCRFATEDQLAAPSGSNEATGTINATGNAVGMVLALKKQ